MARKQHKKQSEKAGLPPGALVHVGRKRKGEAITTSIFYNSIDYKEEVANSFEESTGELKHWLNLDGLHDITAVKKIGNHFKLDNLLLEDVLNTHHRASMQVYDKHIFFTLKMLGIHPSEQKIVREHLSLVLGNTWVLSFQETKGDLFNNIRKRLKEGTGVIREQQTDYLFYRLIDTVVDNYYLVVENMADQVESIEKNILEGSAENPRMQVLNLKKQLIQVRKDISPLREAALLLLKEELNLINSNTKRFLQDVYDHVLHVQDAIDTQRELLNGVSDMYQAQISEKMNQVMQLLTIISTIFIPITFVAGIYGMNFENMPELKSANGYFIAWGVMLSIAIGMLLFFKKKKWL